ncbi:MAG: glycosyltransferase N-terminal domain-containing protein [Bacteroidota bacterium]
MFVYNIAVRFYFLIIRLVAGFNPKAKLWVDGRKGIMVKIENAIDQSKKHVWVHCASLGEFEQGRPVIEKLRDYYPDHRIVLTFFSPSGYEIRKDYKAADFVFYLPEDTRNNAEHFLKILRPAFAIFVKYEYWLNFINQLEKAGIPLYVISANFREDQLFFRWYGGFYRDILHKVSYFFVQNKTSESLLNGIGINKVMISGDTRFDRVAGINADRKEIPLLSQFKQGERIFIAGSTWEADEKLIIGYINANKNEHLKFIIAPHEINEENILELVASIQENVVRYSKTTETEVMNAKVLIIDNIGMLSNLYQYGTIAYIGGGFGKGIHNILEAAAVGMPILFGENHQKFNEAREMVKLGAAIIINQDNLAAIVDDLLNDGMKLHKLANIAKTYVNDNQGATDKILDKIKVIHH